MAEISGLSRGPIFLVGDLNQAGEAHANEVLERLRALDLPNEVIFEFLTMPSRDYLERIDRSVRRSCFISPLGPFLDPGSRGFEAPESSDIGFSRTPWKSTDSG